MAVSPTASVARKIAKTPVKECMASACCSPPPPLNLVTARHDSASAPTAPQLRQQRKRTANAVFHSLCISTAAETHGNAV